MASGMRSTWLRISAVTALVATATPAQPPNTEALKRCVATAWRADVERLQEYAFERRVILRDVDKNGVVVEARERHFRLTPKESGFDELLISENGRPPTGKEIQKSRNKARFSANYEHAETLEINNPLGENLVLSPILGRQEYRILGEDEINGAPCYRAAFEAGSEPGRASVDEQLMQSLRGSACIAIEGCHVLLLDFETVRPIKQGLSRIESMRVTIKTQPVEGGWVLDQVRAEFDFAVARKHFRRTSTYTYSDFDHRPQAVD